jgi:hypothetical protein
MERADSVGWGPWLRGNRDRVTLGALGWVVKPYKFVVTESAGTNDLRVYDLQPARLLLASSLVEVPKLARF